MSINFTKFFKWLWCLIFKCPEPPTPPPAPPVPEPPVPPIPPIPPIPPEIPEPCEPYIGGSYYQLLTSSENNIKWFIGELAKNGGNATEIFLVFSWSDGWKNSPYKIVEYWGEEKYPDDKFPMFDLDQWNEDTWTKFRLICSECDKNGIALFIRIHDYCSIKDSKDKRRYPFNNGSNTQVYTGGMWGDPIRHWYKKLNEKLIDEIEIAGLAHYFIVPMNEADVLGTDPEDTDEWKDDVCVDFHQFYIDNLKSLGVKKNKIILNIDRKEPHDLYDDLRYRMEIHGIASPESMAKMKSNEFPNGDGAKDGQGFSSHGYREPSYLQAIDMGEGLKFGYLYFLRKTEETAIASVLKADFKALRGLVYGLH